MRYSGFKMFIMLEGLDNTKPATWYWGWCKAKRHIRGQKAYKRLLNEHTFYVEIGHSRSRQGNLYMGQLFPDIGKNTQSIISHMMTILHRGASGVQAPLFVICVKFVADCAVQDIWINSVFFKALLLCHIIGVGLLRHHSSHRQVQSQVQCVRVGAECGEYNLLKQGYFLSLTSSWCHN